jgi:pimeloyl-ACP methyl ester carboxylesterase
MARATAVTLLKLAGGLAALYLAFALLITLVQDRLLFPRWAMGRGEVGLPAEAERISIDVPGVGPLVGAQLPAERPHPGESARIIGFGGNAWDADDLLLHLHSLFPDRDIITFHYRGYGPSAGRPSADAILADAERIHDRVIPALGGGKVVVVGLSLGGGPAAHLASLRPVDGVILVTPFDSIEALAADLYPWLPVRLLLRHRMDVEAALSRSSASVAIITAERDEIVPSRRTEALRRAAPDLVLDRVIPGVGHNDIYNSPHFVEAMREALSRIEQRDGPAP